MNPSSMSDNTSFSLLVERFNVPQAALQLAAVQRLQQALSKCDGSALQFSQAYAALKQGISHTSNVVSSACIRLLCSLVQQNKLAPSAAILDLLTTLPLKCSSCSTFVSALAECLLAAQSQQQQQQNALSHGFCVLLQSVPSAWPDVLDAIRGMLQPDAETAGRQPGAGYAAVEPFIREVLSGHALPELRQQLHSELTQCVLQVR